MKRILIQLDTDDQPSSFDAVVAADAGVDQLLSYGGVTPDNVTHLVHGAIFTRGPADLKNTALFIGGSNVAQAEKVFARVQQAFFGPMQVSVLLDPNGSATTAASAVRCAGGHLEFKDNDALILGGTGPVGQRTAQLLARQGARVRIASRELARAEATAAAIRGKVEGAKVISCEWNDAGMAAAVDGVELIVAAGTAGVQFLTAEEWKSIDSLRVIVDLNAVPPAGLQGIDAGDKGADRSGKVSYGALGVGGLKMKIHKAAIGKLFSANDLLLDTEEVYALAGDVG